MKALPPETLEKYRQVWIGRVHGYTFEEIAEAVGYADKSGAKRAFDAASQRFILESVEQQRLVQSARLDEMLKPAMRRVSDGDLSVVDTALRIEKRRAELWGLDAPKRAEVTGADKGPLKVSMDLGELKSKLATLIETHSEGD